MAHTEDRHRTHAWFQVRVVSSRTDGRMFIVSLREDGQRFAVKVDPTEFGVTRTFAESMDIALLSLDHFLVWENDDTEYQHVGGGLLPEDHTLLALRDPWRPQDVEWYLARSPFKRKEVA